MVLSPSLPQQLLLSCIMLTAISGRASVDAFAVSSSPSCIRGTGMGTGNMKSSLPWQGKTRFSSAASSASKTEANEAINGNEKIDDAENKDMNKNSKDSGYLSLDSIRSTLIRQEETIIFAMIERAQFRHNAVVYQPGALISGSDDSFLEYMLRGTEALHASVRRYTSPEEHAFFPDDLPNTKLLLEELEYPQNLLSDVNGAQGVNFNEVLLRKYVDVIVPALTRSAQREGEEDDDDSQYGSSVLCDIAILQALSRRVHYGKFVAESKYQSNPQAYQDLVDAGDADGVMELLTNEKVERKVLRRARLKAATYGREPVWADVLSKGEEDSDSDANTSIVAAAAASAVVSAMEAIKEEGEKSSLSPISKVCPGIVETIYRDLIIPLTKDIEVVYLFLRCGRQPPEIYGSDRMSTDL